MVMISMLPTESVRINVPYGSPSISASSSAFATTAKAPARTAANSHTKTATPVAGLRSGDRSRSSKKRKSPAVPKTKTNGNAARTTDVAGLAAERREVMGRDRVCHGCFGSRKARAVYFCRERGIIGNVSLKGKRHVGKA
jgi:hypothetical protein